MKVTSAEANKMIKKLRDDIAVEQMKELNASRFVAATIENIEDARPAYSYTDVRQKTDACEQRIRQIKHALNEFNLRTKPEGFDMTIDEILVYLPQISERMTRLAKLLMKPTKERVMNSARTNIIEYEYANYDYETVKADYDELLALKDRLLLALDKVNNTVQFEI